MRLRYEDVANRLTAAGVDRILWMTCPYLSSSVGVDGLSPRFVDSRDPARVDRLNAIITAMADERPDVDVLAFSDWVNERVDDAAIRPDGSHYEYRGHNPAADAFVDYLNAALSTASVSATTTSAGVYADTEREQLASVRDVEFELGDDRLDAVELALAAEEVGEAHLDVLAVEVVVEVEEVRFEQRRLGVLVERRAPAEVDRTRVLGAVGPLEPPGVHPVGGHAHEPRAP